MSFIDLHCDTLMRQFVAGQQDIYKTDGMVDLCRLRSGGAMAQAFAVFMLPEGEDERWAEPGASKPGDDEYINGCVGILRKALATHSEIIAIALSAGDIERNQSGGRMSALLTLEDCRPLNGRLERIDWLYETGFRAMGLLWNFENCVGSPNSEDPAVMARGLTSFGREAVEYMQQKGILVDVSHLSDGGFWDVANICKRPFAATHSNCRAIGPHRRNLTDGMLRTLAEHGGVAGLNLAPGFLSSDPASLDSRTEQVVAMALHMKKVAGIGVIALGTDFDGIGGRLELDGPDKLPLLAEALQHAGFSAEEVECIFWRNALRTLHDAIG